ncbi:ABC transporter permease [Clostridium saccharoperbutylacetonicum]|uniref:ABC transporter permease n=1 Tax=Clostridium saccharoperbutylacetonicum TaxID=36745 RepID=UPI000983D60C|nr:ABC transporter permease [Clostridium saccharoperbutylacetonicum]AQR96064.1 ABC transporter permease YtrF precursor [Clostridium saccharoperbutylacetonicum]NSB31933.1 putative ABC transport system permease protein [Clostridium saccharoperbutylacetonicum]
MNSYSEIALRYMKQNKKRTLLTITGLVLATILIFAIGTFILSFRDNMIEDIRNNGEDYEFELNNLNSEQADKVIDNAEVKNASISRIGNNSFTLKDQAVSEVYVNYVDSIYFQTRYPFKIIEGNVPKALGEIIIDTYTKEKLKVKTGDSLTLKSEAGEDKTFKVVGVSEPKYYSGINIYSYLDNTKLDNKYTYGISVNLKSEKNKQKIIEKVISQANIESTHDKKYDNNTLLYLTDNGGDYFKSYALQNMAIFIVGIIMVSTIIVVYNSFNISVIERMRYFGILKAIGATPRQIRRIVFKEGIIMGIVALPIGCALSLIFLKVGIGVFVGHSLMDLENFKVKSYPIVIVVTAFLVAITIFISLLFPVKKAMKISAVDAMKNRNYIKVGKSIRKKNMAISKIFSIEGRIAYKNIRRTPFRFAITVLALTISITLFNVFYGAMTYVKQLTVQEFNRTAYEAAYYKNDSNDVFSDEELKEIKGKEFTKNIYTYKTAVIDLVAENKFLNDEFKAKAKNSFNSKVYGDLGYTRYNNIRVIAGDSKNLEISKKYIFDGAYDEETLKNGGVILVEGCKVADNNNLLQNVKATNYKVGDKIKIPKAKTYAEPNGLNETSYKEWQNNLESEIKASINKNEFYELPIIAIANKEPFNGNYTNSIDIIMSSDLCKDIIGNFNPTQIYLNYDNDKARENASDYFEGTKTISNCQYEDAKGKIERINRICNQIEIFVYCFIIIISIIAIVNIFNTISTNLLIRKKELSTYKAIGMTEKQLNKSIIIEGTFYGMTAAMFGGITSALLLLLFTKIIRSFSEIKFNFAVIPFLLSIGCTILITYISTLAPMKRIKKLTIVEGISDEE